MGDTLGIVERFEVEYMLSMTENDGATVISLVDLTSDEVCYSTEINGRVSAVYFKDNAPLVAWDGAYYISETDMKGMNVARLVIELEE